MVYFLDIFGSFKWWENIVSCILVWVFWIWLTSGLEELELWKECAICRFMGWGEGYRNIWIFVNRDFARGV